MAVAIAELKIRIYAMSIGRRNYFSIWKAFDPIIQIATAILHCRLGLWYLEEEENA